MRRFDKKLKIENANILAEKRYLATKGLISESFNKTSDVKIDEDINNNSLYRNLMDVLSSSNASKNEKKDILEIILKEMSDVQKFINHR
jgi:exonuclease I